MPDEALTQLLPLAVHRQGADPVAEDNDDVATLASTLIERAPVLGQPPLELGRRHQRELCQQISLLSTYKLHQRMDALPLLAASPGAAGSSAGGLAGDPRPRL